MKYSNGYTLIELIFVIIIISILATVSIIKFPSSANLNLQSAKSKLTRDLRFAQTSAILRKRVLGLKFDLPNSKYSIYEGELQFNNVIKDPAENTSYDVQFASLFPGVKLVSTNISGEMVQFDASGVPSDAAGRLHEPKQIVIGQVMGEKQLILTIIPQTGLIK